MALGSHNVPGFNELLSATIQRIESQLVDQVLESHPSLEILSGKMQAADGPNMTVPVRGNLLGNTEVSADDLGSFTVAQDTDLISTVKYDFGAPIITPTSVAWKALALNAGSNQVVDLVRAHIEAAKDDHALAVAKAWHGTGVAAGEFNSLADIVDDTAILGGVNPATKTFWKSTVVTGTYASDDIRLKMREVQNGILDASMKKPDVIIAGANIFDAYESSLDSAVRYNALATGETRFRELVFDGIKLRRDGTDCPADRAYFLNTSTLIARNLRGYFMRSEEEQIIPGTLTKVLPMASVLMTGTVERRSHGRLDMS